MEINDFGRFALGRTLNELYLSEQSVRTVFMLKVSNK